MVTKTNIQHIVPLSKQAVAILKELHPLTGDGRYVFPGARSSQRPMSDNAVVAAMRRMGIAKEEMTGHGFRAAARTILDEVLGFRGASHRAPVGSCCARSSGPRLQPNGALARTARRCCRNGRTISTS